MRKKTEEMLLDLGVQETDIRAIRRGEVHWDLVPGKSGFSDLLLFKNEGGVRPVASVEDARVDELIAAHEFEGRASQEVVRPSTFPLGEYDDWTGIRPGSDWPELVDAYRDAVAHLAEVSKRDAAPYLYMCRHLLELQLKAIIMLGQRVLKVEADLPSHHSLQHLWSAALPIARLLGKPSDHELAAVRDVVDHYHEADPTGENFRYPVRKGNTPIPQKTFVLAFSRSKHVSQFRNASEHLDEIIKELKRRGFWIDLFAGAVDE